jgi:surface protein
MSYQIKNFSNYKINLTIPLLVPSDFITTWNIAGSNELLTVPLLGTGTIDWGDSTGTETTVSNATPSHTYATSGNYVVTFAGTSLSFKLSAVAASAPKLISVDQWGTSGLGEVDLRYSTSLTSIDNTLDPGTLNLSNFLRDSTFNGDISLLTTKNVTDMQYMFYAAVFNQDISLWNVSNVTNMVYMFINAAAFDQNISLWDVSKVTNMIGTFQGAAAFNQDISSWDVSSVTHMHYMFYDATLFNQGISGWTVSQITNPPTDFSLNCALIPSNHPNILWA